MKKIMLLIPVLFLICSCNAYYVLPDIDPHEYKYIKYKGHIYKRCDRCDSEC